MSIAGGGGAPDDLVVDVGDVHDPRDRVARASAGSGRAGRRTGTSGSCRCGPARRPSARTSRCRRARLERLERSRLARSACRAAGSSSVRSDRGDARAAEIDRPAPSAPSRLPVDALTLTASGASPSSAGDRRRASRRDAPPSRGRRGHDRQVDRGGRQPASRQAADGPREQLRAGDARAASPVRPGTGARDRRAPLAPSSASATAWSATSPSEWPWRRGAPAISIPPSRSGSPGSEGMAVVADPRPRSGGSAPGASAAPGRGRRGASP